MNGLAILLELEARLVIRACLLLVLEPNTAMSTHTKLNSNGIPPPDFDLPVRNALIA